MDKEKLDRILENHRLWWNGKGEGRANLSGSDLIGANLHGADLRHANLRGADLHHANLRGADLRHANLSGADLRRANLSGADLSGADLSGADLSGADLRRANLSGTCLDSTLLDKQRQFVRECPIVSKHGGRIVWRTARSKWNGTTEYTPGHTYIAPVISADIVTECHPGIYAASRQWFERENYDDPLVPSYVRDGDWFITAKGAIRCKRLRVLSTPM